ncbi:unnamed protein product [Cochlearia groenlandica]
MKTSENSTNSSLLEWLGLIEDSDQPSSSSPPRVIALLASLLDKMIQKNHKPFHTRHNKEEEITIFHGSRSPTMTIHRYIERIYKYARCSPSCFVAAFAYILKYIQRPETTSMTRHRLTSLNIHRLLITSLLIAAKFLDRKLVSSLLDLNYNLDLIDCNHFLWSFRTYNNAYYAKIGGVSTEEMNKLERMFLFDIDFRLNITVEMFEKHCLMLKREKVPCDSRKLRTVLGEISCSCQTI